MNVLLDVWDTKPDNRIREDVPASRPDAYKELLAGAARPWNDNRPCARRLRDRGGDRRDTRVARYGHPPVGAWESNRCACLRHDATTEAGMAHEDIERSVSSHYGWSGLMEIIEEEIRRHGIEPREVTVAQLAPVDNYHWLRLAGTLALAEAVAITSTERVLDVGGGIGGPARQLAYRFECHVTVLDVTPEYCAVGEKLTE